MQPDPTPDLDEIEACASLLAAYGAHDSNATMPELLCGAADGARAIREALRLIRQARAEGARAARERDELRARAEKAEARAKELEAKLVSVATAHYGSFLSRPEPEAIEAAKDALREAEPCLRADNWHGAADQVSAALAKLEGRS